MAIIGIATLKKWFAAGKYPTGMQFASMVDSFWHKDEFILISRVKELADRLNKKCETSWGQDVQEVLSAKAEVWHDIKSSGASFSVDFKKCRIVLLEGVRDAEIMEIVPHMFEVNMRVLREQYAQGVNRFDAIIANSIICGFYLTANEYGDVSCRVAIIDNDARLIDYSIEIQQDPIDVENKIPADEA